MSEAIRSDATPMREG